MRVLLVQLSDLHLKADRSVNSLLSRLDALANASAGLPDEVDGTLVIVSGDVAYSGLSDEYSHAFGVIEKVVNKLAQRSDRGEIKLVIIPGNHDCDFSQHDQARELLIDQLRRKQLTDHSPISACLVVQTAYRQFCEEISHRVGPGIETVAVTSLVEKVDVSIATETVSIAMLNTAWCSKKNEQQGALTVPVAALRDVLDTSSTSALTVVAMHHPYSWFPATTKQELRTTLEEWGDVILTGHEHVSDIFTKSRYGMTSEFVEGGTLQDSNDHTHSSFNVVLLDTAAGTIDSSRYEWNSADSRYVRYPTPTEHFNRNRKRLRGTFQLTESFNAFLDDCGIQLRHPRKKHVVLSDLFVYPALREVSSATADDSRRHVRGDALRTVLQRHPRVLITGPPSSGKTSLAKAIYRETHAKGGVPVYVDGSEITQTQSGKLIQLINRAVKEQYREDISDRFWELEKHARTVILDDYHAMSSQNGVRSSVLRELTRLFGQVVIFGGDEVAMEEFTTAQGDDVSIWEFKHLELLEFGYQLRAKLISNWLSLSDGEDCSYHLDDAQADTEQRIDWLIGTQLLPALPLYIVCCLQQLEAASDMQTEAWSVGYIFDRLILDKLPEATLRQTDLRTNRSYLSALAYWSYIAETHRWSEEDLEQWHDRHCDEFGLRIPFRDQIDSLMLAGFLRDTGDYFAFAYPHVFYYFVSIYLAENLQDDEIREGVQGLCGRLYHEASASIVLFLCHHSSDRFVLDCVIGTARGLFSDFDCFDIGRDTAFLVYVPPLTRAIKGNVHDRRAEARLDADDATFEPPLDEEQPWDNEDLDDINEALQMNAAIKSIRVIGQILRNHVGALRKDAKKEYVEACYSLGLRVLKCLFAAAQSNEDGLVKKLVTEARKRSGRSISDVKLEQITRDEAKDSVWGTLQVCTHRLIRNISDSIGTERLDVTFREVRDENPSTALSMIDVSIRLDHFRTFPVDPVIKLASQLKKNKELFAYCVLRDLVYMRFYLFHSKVDVRQSVCDHLDIGHNPAFIANAEKAGRLGQPPAPKLIEGAASQSKRQSAKAKANNLRVNQRRRR